MFNTDSKTGRIIPSFTSWVSKGLPSVTSPLRKSNSGKQYIDECAHTHAYTFSFSIFFSSFDPFIKWVMSTFEVSPTHVHQKEHTMLR